jgi:hypothetical protein
MRRKRLEPHKLYHFAERSGAFEGRVYEFLMLCQLRYDERSRKRPVLQFVALKDRDTGLSASTLVVYRPCWPLVQKVERVEVKDLPLFVSWGWKTGLYSRLLNGEEP